MNSAAEKGGRSIDVVGLGQVQGDQMSFGGKAAQNVAQFFAQPIFCQN
jgi:hypothetical protein